MCQETLLPTAAALDVDVAGVSGACGLPNGLGDVRVGAAGVNVGAAVDVGAWCVEQEKPIVGGRPNKANSLVKWIVTYCVS